MFLVFVFLILAVTMSYLFPAWSWGIILLVAFGVVVALRILLTFKSR